MTERPTTTSLPPFAGYARARLSAWKSSTPPSVRREEVLAVIQKGIPIYWLIPGHARLLIGVHPGGGVVYTDSWGPGHEFKTMTWTDFRNLNREMWILAPDDE